MKATFFERLGAYILDSIIVTLILSIICIGISDNNTKYQEQLGEVESQFLSNEITNEEFLNKYESIIYEEQKSSLLTTGISLSLTVAYFIVFQYMNNGQTLGKKLLKLRVVDNDTGTPINNIPRGLLRTLLPYSITSSIFNVAFIKVLPQTSFFTFYIILGIIESVFTIISIFFILYKKDGRGLHDIVAKTKVIHE